MDCVSANVVHFEGCIPRYFAFYRSRPRLNVRIERILRFDHRDERKCGCGEWHQSGMVGEHLVAQLGHRWIRGWVETVADAIGIDIRRVIDLATLIGIEEDSVPAANNHFRGEAVVNAQPRRERFLRAGMRHRPAIAQDGSAVSASTGYYSAGSQLRIGIAKAAISVLHVEPEEVVQGLRGRGAEIPPQAHADGQLGCHFPVIFSVRREVLEDVRLRVTGLVWVGKGRSSRYKSANPREVPQHHVGHGIAGAAKWCSRSPVHGDGWVGTAGASRVLPGSRTRETPIAVEIAVQIAGQRVRALVEAQSDSVASANHAERISPFPRRAVRAAVGVDRSAAAVEIGQVHVGPGLLQRSELLEYTGLIQLAVQCRRRSGRTLRSISIQIAEAEVVDTRLADVDGVRYSPGFLVLEVLLDPIVERSGVVERVVHILGVGEAAEDGAELAQGLVPPVGLLVGNQGAGVVLSEVVDALWLGPKVRRRPEFVVDCSQPDPAGKASRRDGV